MREKKKRRGGKSSPTEWARPSPSNSRARPRTKEKRRGRGEEGRRTNKQGRDHRSGRRLKTILESSRNSAVETRKERKGKKTKTREERGNGVRAFKEAERGVSPEFALVFPMGKTEGKEKTRNNGSFDHTSLALRLACGTGQRGGRRRQKSFRRRLASCVVSRREGKTWSKTQASWQQFAQAADGSVASSPAKKGKRTEGRKIASHRRLSLAAATLPAGAKRKKGGEKSVKKGSWRKAASHAGCFSGRCCHRTAY